MTVRRMLDEMSSDELTEWAAFYRLDPWGEQRADLRQAMTTAATVNVHCGKGKGVKAQDFMPYTQKAAQTPEQIIEAMRMAKGLANGNSR